MSVQKPCCSKCGFPLDMERDIVILKNDIFSIIHLEEDRCEECGHFKDGTTIKVVKKKFDEAIRKRIDERNNLIKFIHHYQFLTEEQKMSVCLTMPRFMRENYKSKGNQEEDDLEEPYSWSVVFMEVINDTKLSKAMLNNIDWEKLDKEDN